MLNNTKMQIKKKIQKIANRQIEKDAYHPYELTQAERSYRKKKKIRMFFLYQRHL
jgi:hypothetical protein